MVEIVVVALVVGILCATISGLIAQQKGLPAGGYMVAGFILGVIGLVIAALARPAARTMPGWYPDPWQQAPLRWHDGQQWTAQTHNGVSTPYPAPATVTDALS
jgi:hypothetical protein